MKKLDIGEVYKSAFKQYKPTPAEGGFKAVQEALRLRKLRIRRLRIAGASALIIAVAALTWMFWPVEPNVEQGLIADNESITETITRPDAAVTETADIPSESLNSHAEVEAATDPQSETGDATIDVPETIETAAIVNPQPIQELSRNDTPFEPIELRQGTNTSADQESEDTDQKEDNSIWVSSDTTICLGESVRLEAEGGVSYEWGNGSQSSFLNVTPESTNYYRVHVTDDDNAIHTYTIVVKVRDCAELIVPNAFTPNGDGENDDFLPIGRTPANYQMRIFSRNGQLVFETSDFFMGWNGDILGQPAAQASYVYVITYENRLGEPVVKRGSITLLK